MRFCSEDLQTFNRGIWWGEGWESGRASLDKVLWEDPLAKGRAGAKAWQGQSPRKAEQQRGCKVDGGLWGEKGQTAE